MRGAQDLGLGRLFLTGLSCWITLPDFRVLLRAHGFSVAVGSRHTGASPPDGTAAAPAALWYGHTTTGGGIDGEGGTSVVEFRNMLCPIDLSDASSRPIAYATAFAVV